VRAPDPSLPPAIVIDPESIAGLQSARILARHGVPVIGLGNPSLPYCRTKACQRVIPADTASAQFIEVLEDLGPKLDQPAVILAAHDRAVVHLSEHRDRIAPWFRLALPPHDVVETLLDKVRFYAFAEENDLPIPATRFLRERADAEAAAQALGFPAILKPPVRNVTWRRHTSAKVYKVESPEAFLERYDEVAGWTDELVVQEWIEGGEEDLFSCNAYFDRDSNPVATFVARKIRQWPPYIGVSCLGEEVRNDDVLRETIRLFQSVGFHGLAYLEMKRDVRTGRHYIVEPNVGRATGRSAIAEAGGVDLHYAMYADLAGVPMPVDLEQHYTGVKWIYLRRDFQAALRQWLLGEITLREWRDSWRAPRAWADFAWDDPGPFFYDLLQAARGIFGAQGRAFFRRFATPSQKVRRVPRAAQPR
jgi:predicted ATP-grasp superfamily ATP-dependent carboligase